MIARSWRRREDFEKLGVLVISTADPLTPADPQTPRRCSHPVHPFVELAVREGALFLLPQERPIRIGTARLKIHPRYSSDHPLKEQCQWTLMSASDTQPPGPEGTETLRGCRTSAVAVRTVADACQYRMAEHVTECAIKVKSINPRRLAPRSSAQLRREKMSPGEEKTPFLQHFYKRFSIFYCMTSLATI